MPNIVTGGLLLLAMGGTAAVIVGDVFAYILCFMILALTILFGLLALAIQPIWKLFPQALKKRYKIKKERFKITILLSAPLFFIFMRGVNKNFWPDASASIRILGDMGIFLFATFLGWSFIKYSKWRTIFLSIGAFVLFVALLSFINSTVLRSNETTETVSLKKLASLGYVGWVPAEAERDIKKTGVTQYDPELAFEGMNLYASKTLSEAYLIDMYGNIVHKWATDGKWAGPWQYAEMCDNGDLLVVADDQMLMRLDWNSNIKWNKEMRAHHDVWIDKGKNIYVLGREEELVFWHGIPVPIISDYVAVLSTNGELKKKVRLYDLMKELVPLRKIVKVYGGVLNYKILKKIIKRRANGSSIFTKINCFDILHTNSLEIVNSDIDGFCGSGDWLLSSRALDVVVVVDSRKGKLVWNWGPGEVSKQHHPTLLENGNLLIFDNGTERGFTRIVELNPLTKKLVWEYKSDTPEEFFSPFRGCNQRLPNGNTLVTESDKGRVFEVTKQGKVVWEFYNPNVDVEDEKREVIYRMMRIWDFEKGIPEKHALKKTDSSMKI